MILMPTDTELTWPQVEAGLEADARMAEGIWFEAGIIMPDGTADEMTLDAMAAFLLATGEAVGLPEAEVYGARNRLRWITLTDGAGAWPTYASLDGNQPARIMDRANECGGVVNCDWNSYRS